MNPKIIFIIAVIILLLLLYYRKSINKNVNEFIMDKVTQEKIKSLHPAIRPKAEELINRAANKGIYLRIYDGLRSFESQLALFNQGRTTPGQIVTNAEPGESFHNYGLAFDTVEIKDGKALWDNPRWNEIGELGESLGLQWGGRFKSIKDLPHFEILNYPLSHAQRQYAKNDIDKNGFINLT